MKIFILLWIMVLILSGYATCIVSPTYAPAITSTAMESHPIGAPTPPNLNAEQLVLSDFNLLKPSMYPSQGPSGISPSMYPSQGCQAIFPQSTVSKCNRYYIQVYSNQLCNQAGVRCGEYLPLLSNIGRAGTYWSYEWAQCGSNYCYPEVKNFGNKGFGWYQTWFISNKPGWHILSYWCNDWSNYIYIYVWPSG